MPGETGIDGKPYEDYSACVEAWLRERNAAKSQQIALYRLEAADYRFPFPL